MNKGHLGRRGAHYKALMRNLIISLVEHGKIRTTVPKVKRLIRFIDPLITKAKNNNLTSYRALLSATDNINTVNKLMKIGEVNKNREGGYLSYRRVGIRKGDCSVEAEVRIIDYPRTVDSSSSSNDSAEAGNLTEKTNVSE